MDFKKFLANLIDNVDGIKIASFCGTDGIGIDTVILDSTIEKMEMEVEISMMLKMVNDLTKKMDIGSVNSFFFEAENLVGILEKCSGDYFISLLMNPDGNLGRARYELKKIARKIEKQLGFKGV